MEQCGCLPLNSKFARKSVLVKTKPLNRQTVISINQLFKVLSTGTNTCPQPWPPLINGLVEDALLELSRDRNYPLLQIVMLFVSVDSTLNNWLIEITVCLLKGLVFTRTLFRANFEFKGKQSHICQKQLLYVFAR